MKVRPIRRRSVGSLAGTSSTAGSRYTVGTKPAARHTVGTKPAARRTVGGALAAVLAAIVLLAGCSALGLDSATDDLPTSSAPVPGALTAGQSTQQPAVTLGSLPAATTTPTLQYLTSSSSAAPSTTSAPPLTAPTTTRVSLTFSSLAPVTKPTVAKPSDIASPPPDCYAAETCRALSRADAGGGIVVAVAPPGGKTTVLILEVAGKAVDALAVAALSTPTLSCVGSYCLVQSGGSPVFGDLAQVSGSRLRVVSDQINSAGPLKLRSVSGALMVSGSQRFGDYGLPPSDTPVGSRTWVLDGSLTSTGCGTPVLYRTPPTPDSAQRGPCSGTPQISGWGSASAHPLVSIGGFATPSGNIACAVVSAGQLGCTVKQHDFAVKACTKPVSEVPAGLRGVRVLLGSDAPYIDGCLGYTLVGSPRTAISYGRLAVGGGFVCEVQESGVTCVNKVGHGFTLTRGSYRTR